MTMLDRVRRVPGFAFDAALALAALLVSILDLAFWLRVRDPLFPGHANALAYAPEGGPVAVRVEWGAGVPAGVPLAQAVEMIRVGEIHDAKTIASVLMYERFHLPATPSKGNA